jgi:voltage-gated potassium channel Kch
MVGIVVLAAFVLAIFRVRINDKDVGFFEAFWQSMLRVLDPGTFAGDNGWGLRVVALLITLTGIFLASALIGIIATAIDHKIEDLRRGRSFVVEFGHTLIVGWSPRIFTIVSEICLANENQSKPCIVVLSPVEKPEMEEKLRTRVHDTHGTRIVCRTGDPASLHDLSIVNASSARSVIVLGDVDNAAGDAEVVKAVLAVLIAADDPSVPIVVELSDDVTERALREASDGRALCVRSTDVIARITAQACRQSGLSRVCQDLLDFEGDEIYFQAEPRLVGHTFGEAVLAFEASSVIGIRRASGEVALNPPMDTAFGPDDAVIVVSEDDDTVVFSGWRDEAADDVVLDPPPDDRPQQILVVGWNALGPIVLAELDQFVPPRSSACVVIDRDLLTDDELEEPALERIDAEFRVGQGDIDKITSIASQQQFDHVIILGYRGRLAPTESDARTLLTLLLLHRAAEQSGHRGRVVAELLDSRDVELAQATGADDFIVSDALSSYMMAQLAENPELDLVFGDLFDAEGSAVGLKPANWYTGVNGEVPFARIVAAARARGEVAIGYRVDDDGDGVPEIVMNPPKSQTVALAPNDRVVVIGPPE